MNKVSKLFQPIRALPKDAVVKDVKITSKSQRLMLANGLIRHAGNGTFYVLPLLQRSIDKCVVQVDRHMQSIGAHKLSLPTLTSVDLWKKSGRLEAATELLKTTDRHSNIQILSPTHEESITDLMASCFPISHKQFPLKLYQISTKFRDELKPRFGLMRAKEFLMKDLYTFDISLEAAQKTYEEVNEAYKNFFDQLKIPYVKVEGDTGDIGGSASHEYHFPSFVGEDQLLYCSTCKIAINHEIYEEKPCDQCSNKNIVKQQGIEVAHTFILEDKYSKALDAKFMQSNGKPNTLQMGCYGIGISRLIAASIECLSLENEIRWPLSLAPYALCIIPPKSGSKEEEALQHWTEKLYAALNSNEFLRDNVIVDDRPLTIGKRLVDTKHIGYPLVIVIGPKTVGPDGKFELHNLNTNEVFELNFDEMMNQIKCILE